MWQPVKAEIKNLLTHEQTIFPFKKNKCIMIFGINSTDSGADSNGGGKSTILEGMTLALTGETNRDVSKDDFIMDEEEECYTGLELTNEVGDVKHLEIKRWFYRKKSSKVQIWENGEHNKKITSVNEANKRIYELIGLTKDDLLHFFMVGQETNYSFLTANDTDKKDIIMRFSNIEFINKKIDQLKLDRKIEEEKLKDFSTLILKDENKIEFFEERNVDLTVNFREKNNEKITSIKDKISREERLKKSKKSEIVTLKAKLTTYKSEAKEIIIEDVSELKSKLETQNTKLKNVKSEISTAELTVGNLEDIYEGKVTCPSCSHEFSLQADIEISEIPELINQSNNIMVDLEESKAIINRRIKNLESKIELNSENEDLKSTIDRKIKRTNSSISDIENDLKSFDNKIKNFNDEIDTLKSKSVDSEVEKNNVEINKLKTNLKTLKLDKGEIDLLILDIDYWVYHFGKKGFLTFLTNKSIKSIEGVTNSYLKKMNSDLQLLIEGYTKLQSGDIREKISISIVRNGLKVASFNRYSGGEKGRIKLANILGLQHLINLTAKNGGLNFLGLDEVFEGLDQTGQIDVLNILENLKVTSLVITHRNQPIGAENEIYIEKKNGISRITDKKYLNLAHEKDIKSNFRKIRKQVKKNS